MEKRLKISTLFSAIVLGIFGCQGQTTDKTRKAKVSQKEGATSLKQSQKSDSSKSVAKGKTITPEPLPKNFYKNFTGTVAGDRVRLVLESVNGKINGTYFYSDKKPPVDLSEVEGETAKDTLVLGENVGWSKRHDEHYALWKLVYGQGQLVGTWVSKDRPTTVPIHLMEKYPEGVHRFTYLARDASAFIIPGDTSSPHISLNMVVAKATSDNDDARWLNQKIKKLCRGLMKENR